MVRYEKPKGSAASDLLARIKELEVEVEKSREENKDKHVIELEKKIGELKQELETTKGLIPALLSKVQQPSINVILTDQTQKSYSVSTGAEEPPIWSLLVPGVTYFEYRTIGAGSYIISYLTSSERISVSSRDGETMRLASICIKSDGAQSRLDRIIDKNGKVTKDIYNGQETLRTYDLGLWINPSKVKLGDRIFQLGWNYFRVKEMRTVNNRECFVLQHEEIVDKFEYYDRLTGLLVKRESKVDPSEGIKCTNQLLSTNLRGFENYSPTPDNLL